MKVEDDLFLPPAAPPSPAPPPLDRSNLPPTTGSVIAGPPAPPSPARPPRPPARAGAGPNNRDGDGASKSSALRRPGVGGADDSSHTTSRSGDRARGLRSLPRSLSPRRPKNSPTGGTDLGPCKRERNTGESAAKARRNMRSVSRCCRAHSRFIVLNAENHAPDSTSNGASFI